MQTSKNFIFAQFILKPPYLNAIHACPEWH